MKIAIIGYSGSGKSTLAAFLGAKLGIEVLHLDTLHFLPGWVERPPEEEQRLLAEFMDSHESWIIDGNYSKNLYARRMEEADRIIFLCFDRFACFYRGLKRYLGNRGHSRQSMAEGCPEKFDREFILWILRDGRKAAARERYAKVCDDYANKITVIRNQREMDAFCREMETI